MWECVYLCVYSVAETVDNSGIERSTIEDSKGRLRCEKYLSVIKSGSWTRTRGRSILRYFSLSGFSLSFTILHPSINNTRRGLPQREREKDIYERSVEEYNHWGSRDLSSIKTMLMHVSLWRRTLNVVVDPVYVFPQCARYTRKINCAHTILSILRPFN